MEFEYFETLIEESTKRIPEKFKTILRKENIKIIAREKVPEIIKNKFHTEFVFGTFTGIPYSKRSVFNIQTEPTRIELYKETFEKMCNSKEDIRQRITKTIIHEIAHYFGFSEKQIRETGY